LNIDNITNVTKQAISDKLKNIDCEKFDSLRKKILNHIQTTGVLSNSKIYAIDGCKLSFSKNLNAEGFKLTKNKKYTKGLMSGLYDINNKLCIKCCIDKHSNERKAFIDKLLPEIPPNSTVLFDAGYYFKNLVKILNKKGFKYVIRMKKSSLMVKDMERYNIDDYYKLDINYGLIRIVRYTIENKKYYLATNIFDQFIDYFIDLYHKRWFIEEYFKTLKSHLKSNNYNCQSLINNEQQLYCQIILTIISRYLQLLSKKYNPKTIKTKKNNKHNGTYSINHKNTLNIVINKIMYMLLYKRSNKKIINCIIIAGNNIVYIRKGRKCPRIRIKPVSKWYYIGLSIK